MIREPQPSDLENALQGLTPSQLTQVLAFVTFLTTEAKGATGTSQPPDPSPPPPPTDPDEPPTEIAPNDDPAAASDLSLAWMLRMVIGDADLERAASPTLDPLSHRHLGGVPLIPQQQSEWCWAATAQMILQSHGVRGLPTDPATAQLELVRSVDPLRRQSLAPQQLNGGGWPPFERWGCEATVLDNPHTLGREQVQGEIDAGRPFAISWHYPGRSGHMLVVVGYVWVGEALWLVAHDPWPAGPHGGDRCLISYAHYVTGLAGTWRTYFAIRPARQPLIREPPGVAPPLQPPLQPPPPPQGPPTPSENSKPGSGWEAFLDNLGDSTQRHAVIAGAIQLLEALAQPETALGRDLGIFSSDPGDPQHFHFFHILPVLELPRRLPALDDEALLGIFTRFHRAVVMIGGEHGHLTSITLRQDPGGGEWSVIRIGRSHIVQAFHRLNRWLVDDATLTVRGHEIVVARHLTHLPLVMLRLPDARQYLLLMEVVGAPRQHVPFLFFPIYDDPSSGFEAGQILTWEDLQEIFDASGRSFPPRNENHL